MRITSFPKQEGCLTLCLQGRLDTLAAEQAKTDIERYVKNLPTTAAVTLDAEGLEYISSSGLRIVLALAKRFPELKVTEVSEDVYHVFEMTGFTKILHVEKALRRIDIAGCTEIGRGGVGTVYRLDDETIVKVFREGTTMDEVQQEISMAKEAFVLGMPTAISFDTVRVNGQLGLVYELLRADTLSACLKRQPERLDDFARQYAKLFRCLHDIEVPASSQIPNAKARTKAAVEHIARYFDDQDIELMMHIAEHIPDCSRLLHCDLQTKNIMLQGDEMMLIDMGEVGYGHPMIDLGNSYSSMVKLMGDSMQIVGLPSDLAARMWQTMIGHYFPGIDEREMAHRMEQIEVVASVRNFSWLSLSDSFPETIIAACREAVVDRIRNRKDFILRVCDTMEDWTL